MKDTLLSCKKEFKIFYMSTGLTKKMESKSRFRIHWLSFLFIVWFPVHLFQADAETCKTTINRMKNAVINANGELVVLASASSTASDFKFLLGTYNIVHKKLKTRLAGSVDWEEFSGLHIMESLWKGIGNLEQHIIYSMESKTEGMALRLFDSSLRLWSIHWANSESSSLDVPMIGSFEDKVGFFYAKDHYQRRPISVQFKWDAINAEQPVWSQAFSVDKGETWEWNWHMYLSKAGINNNHSHSAIDESDSTIPIGVIELRNYVIKHGLRDSFMQYFEENFIKPQEALQGYLLGQYRVKGAQDNFCWIRGFKDMGERSKFLPAFYYGPFWKQHKQVANAMLANNDNVYLLKPLLLHNDSLEPAKSINHFRLIPANGIAVVEFYTANTKLDQLLQLFARKYLPFLQDNGVSDLTLWTSVLEENDFPRLPVFQDKNLLVTITFYKDELQYEEAMKKIDSKMSDDLKGNLQDVITIKSKMILYPTEKTINKKS